MDELIEIIDENERRFLQKDALEAARIVYGSLAPWWKIEANEPPETANVVLLWAHNEIVELREVKDELIGRIENIQSLNSTLIARIVELENR